MKEIDANQVDYLELGQTIRSLGGEVAVRNCLGHRFIGAGLRDMTLQLYGIPGNALGAYLDGAKIVVHGNAQDAVGDTMNAGRIVIHGDIGDTAGYAMRGGEIFVRGDAGYRAGIHMKEYQEHIPVMIIGGRAGSFLGEYQAGGILVVLGLHDGGEEKRPIVSNYPCTGMHGGRLFLRSACEDILFPDQVTPRPATAEDLAVLAPYLRSYAREFGLDFDVLMDAPYTVVTPGSRNPYQQMYVAN